LAHDAVTGPLVQCCWPSPVCALHQPQGHRIFQKGLFLRTFPLAGGQSSTSSSPALWAGDTDIYTKQRGPWAHRTSRRLCAGVWDRNSPRHRAKSWGTGCSGGWPACPVSPELAAAARPDTGSRRCSPASPCVGHGQGPGSCHHPNRPWVGRSHGGTCPGLPLPRQTPRWVTRAGEGHPLAASCPGMGHPCSLQPPGQLPSVPTPHPREEQKPPLTGVFLAFLQVWLQTALQASQLASCLGAKDRVHRLDLG